MARWKWVATGDPQEPVDCMGLATRYAGRLRDVPINPNRRAPAAPEEAVDARRP